MAGPKALTSHSWILFTKTGRTKNPIKEQREKQKIHKALYMTRGTKTYLTIHTNTTSMWKIMLNYPINP